MKHSIYTMTLGTQKQTSSLPTGLKQWTNKLNEEGAILLVLDMPKGAEIGIDYNSWLVGESFLGFKMINPGFHCLFYRW